MIESFHVVLSERADRNLADIKKRFEDISEELALTALAYIMTQIRELEFFPFRYPVINPKNHMRQMPINKYT